MNYAGAGFVLFSSDLSQLLLVHDAKSGKWGFPKGHREPSDMNDLHTAVREMWEETGLVQAEYTIHDEAFKIGKGGSSSYLFRYAILNFGVSPDKVRAESEQEIANLEWVPLSTLLNAQNVLDGNKYLRTWISDLQSSVPKKHTRLLRTLLGSRLHPAQESVCANNIVTCA